MVAALDAYGLTKEDFMENMRELQFVIEGDKVLTGAFRALCPTDLSSASQGPVLCLYCRSICQPGCQSQDLADPGLQQVLDIASDSDLLR